MSANVTNAGSEPRYYRRKSNTILAQQYDGLPPEQTKCHGICKRVNALHEGCPNEAHVHTQHAGQVVIVKKGDWIAQEPNGVNYYPIGPAVFEVMYHLTPVDNPTKE